MRIAAVFVAAIVVAALGGCAAQPDVSPNTLIGTSVNHAAAVVPDGRSYAWYDLTEEVLHRPGTLIGGAEPDGEGGVVIAVCADADTIGSSMTIAAGAVPKKYYRGTIKRDAKAGAYRLLLPECAEKSTGAADDPPIVGGGGSSRD